MKIRALGHLRSERVDPKSISACSPVQLWGVESMCIFLDLPGAVEAFDVVILATGFESTHEGWLDPGLMKGGGSNGLHLVGFNHGRC